jgi:hypothetical protein
LLGNPEVMNHLGDLETDGRIIFSGFVYVTVDRAWIGELDLLTTSNYSTIAESFLDYLAVSPTAIP